LPKDDDARSILPRVANFKGKSRPEGRGRRSGQRTFCRIWLSAVAPTASKKTFMGEALPWPRPAALIRITLRIQAADRGRRHELERAQGLAWAGGAWFDFSEPDSPLTGRDIDE
jgi:hypothetical protein